MTRPVYSMFETAFGTCGIAWKVTETEGAQPAIVFLQLPCDTERQTEERIAACSRGIGVRNRPEHIAGLAEKIRLHLDGLVQDFSGIAVDLEGFSTFGRQVLAVCRDIRAGCTMSYGELARIIDHPGAARAVGQVLAKNAVPLIIPCHRVLAADGGMGGFSAPGGVAVKARLLTLEGVSLKGHG